jgi:hypothetical protein
MSKPYTEEKLSELFDQDLVWRRRELSDLKAAVKVADYAAKTVILRSLIAMSYAHWEGFVRLCATRYFDYLAIRKKSYTELERQIYINSFLNRLDSLHQNRVGLEERCKLVNDILDGTSDTFSHINPKLIDTKSNLNTDTMKEICLICSVDPSHFESQRTFIDKIILKRRNAIAHGQQEFIQESEIDDLVAGTLKLMEHFRTLLENKVYLKHYSA